MKKVADAQKVADENHKHCKEYAKKLGSQQVCVVNYSRIKNTLF